MMTILEQIFPAWQYGTGSPVLYYYATDDFTAADGTLIVRGNHENRETWRYSVTCSVSGTNLTIPEHDLPSTYDSDNQNVRWIPVLVYSNRIVPFFLGSFRLPTTGTGNITWEEIRAFDRTATPLGQQEFYTADQQLQLFVLRSESTATITDTDDLTEGSTNLYFTVARVLATVLTGLSTAAGTTVTAAHTILQAIGFLQKQVSDNKSTADTHIANTSNPHSVTAIQLSLGNVNNTSDANKPVSTATQTALDLKENTANKDVTGGYVGLTLFKINFKNALNTFTSFFTNSNTAARTYTFPDRTGTIADDTDITNAKARANHTGTQLASTISDFNASALTAAPAETTATLGATINGASAATPNNTDLVATVESSVVKKITWTNVKAFLKTYFDTLYVIAASLGSGVATFLATPSSANFLAAITDAIGTGKVLFSSPIIRQITATSGTISSSDDGKIVECTNASATSVTVNSGVNNCVVTQYGAGQVTLVAGSGVTLRNRNGLKTAGQYAAVSILPTNTANEFIVSGDTTT